MTSRQSTAVPLPGSQQQQIRIVPEVQMEEYSVEKGTHNVTFRFPQLPGVKVISQYGIRLAGTIVSSTPSVWQADNAEADFGTEFPVYLSNILGGHALIRRITLSTSAGIVETISDYPKLVSSMYSSVVPKEYASSNTSLTERCKVWLEDPAYSIQLMPNSVGGVSIANYLGSDTALNDYIDFQRLNGKNCPGYTQLNHLDVINGRNINMLLQFGNNNNGVDLGLELGFTLTIELAPITESCYVMGTGVARDKILKLNQCSLSLERLYLEVSYMYPVPSNLQGLPGEAGSVAMLSSTQLAPGEFRYASNARFRGDVFRYTDKYIVATQNNVKRMYFQFLNNGNVNGISDPGYFGVASFDEFRFGLNQQPLAFGDELKGMQIIRLGLEASGNWYGDISRSCNISTGKGTYGIVLTTLGPGYNFNGQNQATIKMNNLKPATTYDKVHESALAFGSDFGKIYSGIWYDNDTSKVSAVPLSTWVSNTMELRPGGAGGTNQWGFQVFMRGITEVIARPDGVNVAII